jgi:hypothetical protein
LTEVVAAAALGDQAKVPRADGKLALAFLLEQRHQLGDKLREDVAHIIGDLRRVIEYPKLGYAIEQPVPGEVHDAYQALLRAGFDSRLLSS